jgi:hypothetical protein
MATSSEQAMGDTEHLVKLVCSPDVCPKSSNAANRAQLWLIWMEEDDHVICIKQDRCGQLTARQAPKDTQLDSLSQQPVKRVYD